MQFPSQSSTILDGVETLGEDFQRIKPRPLSTAAAPQSAKTEATTSSAASGTQSLEPGCIP